MNKLPKIFTLLFLPLLFLACRENVSPKPERLLGKKEFADVLLEINSIETAGDNAYFEAESSLKGMKKEDFYARLYKRYGINKTILEQNIVYYSENNKKFVAACETAIKAAEKELGTDTLQAAGQIVQEP